MPEYKKQQEWQPFEERQRKHERKMELGLGCTTYQIDHINTTSVVRKMDILHMDAFTPVQEVTGKLKYNYEFFPSCKRIETKWFQIHFPPYTIIPQIKSKGICSVCPSLHWAQGVWRGSRVHHHS
jgi:hypothetical protein